MLELIIPHNKDYKSINILEGYVDPDTLKVYPKYHINLKTGAFGFYYETSILSKSVFVVSYCLMFLS